MKTHEYDGTVAVLAIGDELLRGSIVDTNSAWLATRLFQCGYRVGTISCLPDDTQRIAEKLQRVWADHSFVVCSGGLGPTVDDLTRQGVALALGVELEEREELLESITHFFSSRSLSMPSTNKRQALVPSGAKALANPIGTAPGFSVESDDRLGFFMPGVPSEMRRMFNEEVLPCLGRTKRGANGARSRSHSTLWATGIGESALDSSLQGLAGPWDDPALGMSCAPGLISLHVVATGENVQVARTRGLDLEEKIRQRIGPYLVETDGVAPIEAVALWFEDACRQFVFVDGATAGYAVSSFGQCLQGRAGKVLAAATIWPPDVYEDQTLLDELQRLMLERRCDNGVAMCLSSDDKRGSAIHLTENGQINELELGSFGSERYRQERFTNRLYAQLWRSLQSES